MNIPIGARARDTKTGLVGLIIAVYDCGIQGDLVVIRLDQEDPTWGWLTTAWMGEVAALEEKGSVNAL